MAVSSWHAEDALLLPLVFFRWQRRSWRGRHNDWLCERVRRTPDEGGC